VVAAVPLVLPDGTGQEPSDAAAHAAPADIVVAAFADAIAAVSALPQSMAGLESVYPACLRCQPG